MNLEYDYLFKILLIGDSGVGKTAMLSKFVDEEFVDNYISTIGVDFRIKTIDLDGTIIKLQIWDTAGQERFRTITSTYYRGSHGVFIVFDLTDLDSYNNIVKWLDEVNRNCIGIQILIIGTKADLHDKRVITPNMIDLIKQKFNYIEVSALTGTNISQAFYELSFQIKNSTFCNLTKNKINHINLHEVKPLNTYNCC